MKDYLATYGANVTGSFPVTTAKNSTTSVSTDGTPFTQDGYNDIWPLFMGMLDRVSAVPSGSQEAYVAVGSGSSVGIGAVVGSATQQHLWAFQRQFSQPGDIVSHFKNATAQAQTRELLLTGQVVDGFLYPDLWYNTWVGAGLNSSAPAFYTTSDSGGTTRAITGLTVNSVTGGRYLKLPDLRGYSLRGVDTSNLRDPAGSTRGLGSAQLDAFQGHEHRIEIFNAGGLPGGTYYFPAYTTTTFAPQFLSNNVGLDASGTIETDGSSGTPRTATETRMVNINCYFSIRY
jgi:hypothetical protein